MSNKLIYKHIDELVPYENNPRDNEKAVDAVANSIKEFGFKVPVIIDENNIIVAGHTRVKASKKLGVTEIPCIVADDLTEEQIRAFRLADNKVAELSEWDFKKLEEELADITMNMEDFGFESKKNDSENPYTMKVDIPKYEPMSEEAPPLSELVNLEKVEELKREIDEADIPEDVKDFLRCATYRHAVFDYGRIAEYYCHAEADVQNLMERSALVIIDFDKAIEYGYTNLKTKLDEMMENDRKSCEVME